VAWGASAAIEIALEFAQLSRPAEYDALHQLQFRRLRPAFDPEFAKGPQPFVRRISDDPPKKRRNPSSRKYVRFVDLPPARKRHIIEYKIRYDQRARQQHKAQRQKAMELIALCRGLEREAADQLARSYHQEYAIPLPMARAFAGVFA